MRVKSARSIRKRVSSGQTAASLVENHAETAIICTDSHPPSKPALFEVPASHQNRASASIWSPRTPNQCRKTCDSRTIGNPRFNSAGKRLTRLHLWLTNKKNIPTAITSTIKIPTTSEATQCRRLMGFDPAPFCAAPMPSQKKRLPIDPIPRCSQIGLGLAWPAPADASKRSSGARLRPRHSSSVPFKRRPRSTQDSNRSNH